MTHAGKSDKKDPVEDTPEFKQFVETFNKSSGNFIAGAGIILIAVLMRSLTRPDTQEISFQHFKTQLLAKDVVDRIEVANKTTAKVPAMIYQGLLLMAQLGPLLSLYLMPTLPHPSLLSAKTCKYCRKHSNQAYRQQASSRSLAATMALFATTSFHGSGCILYPLYQQHIGRCCTPQCLTSTCMCYRLMMCLQVFVRVGAVPRSSGDLSASESDMQPAASSSGSGVPSQHKFSFNIGSVESFDRKMEEAQDALGFDPNEFIPITYTNELSWSQEALRLLPTLLLIGGYVWFTRRSMGSMGGGGLGGGGRGIFNVGKAQVGTVDKNAKDKIMFKVSKPFELTGSSVERTAHWVLSHALFNLLAVACLLHSRRHYSADRFKPQQICEACKSMRHPKAGLR